MKYNFFTWWLSFKPKKLVYKIWKTIIISVLFVLWALFIAVYPESYWEFSIKVILPIAIVDICWDMIAFVIYQKNDKKIKSTEEES